VAALLVLATVCRRPVTLTFDLLTLKSVWESHVTWGTPACAKFRLPRPFGFRVRADVRDIRQTDGQTDGRTTDADDRLMPPASSTGAGA